MRLKYEPASEPLHLSVKSLLLLAGILLGLGIVRERQGDPDAALPILQQRESSLLTTYWSESALSS